MLTTMTHPPLLRRLAPVLLFLGLLMSSLTACDDGGSVDVTITDDGGNAQVETADFFNGLWDGFISPYTAIASLFDDMEIYDDGAGDSYPVGFGLGVFLVVMLLLSIIIGPRYYRRRS